jgi:phosphoribosyl 1,2-cyclic phosphate phosphodiesterase
MKVTILGCGSAAGCPSVSGGWGKCDPHNPKNRRLRSSILVEQGPTALLVDSSPDLREQMLNANVRRVDAVLYTHAHADHIHGIDDLREVNRVTRGPLQIYGPAETLETLRDRFGYAFEGVPEGKPVFRPWLIANDIAPPQSFSVGDISIRPFLQDHGFSSTVGYSFGDIVYSTDLIDLPQTSREIIRGAKVWIIGVLSEQPYATHVHVSKALEWIEDLKPQRAVITHMSNTLDFDTLSTRLPAGVTPAFDGMVIEV